jgi:hypothetical protein
MDVNTLAVGVQDIALAVVLVVALEHLIPFKTQIYKREC